MSTPANRNYLKYHIFLYKFWPKRDSGRLLMQGEAHGQANLQTQVVIFNIFSDVSDFIF
jgi:hypothetical protein